MAALTADKARRQETWKHKSFTLASGTKAFKGGRACLNSVGKVVPATASAVLRCIGIFDETVDATAGDKLVSVDLETEIILERFVNGSGGDAVAAANVGQLCYMLDDQTVSILGSGKPVAGRVWDVSSKGVAVEKLRAIGGQVTGALPAAVAGDVALAAVDVVHDALYPIATTTGATTVTLPAATPVGTELYFAADGVANGHTVTYRDATGNVALTTALLASKRHLVVCVKLSATVWTANAYVSP